MGAISVSVRKTPDASSLEFEAVFPEGDGSSWELQLPCWRPGRYELGNFAQYITKMVGVASDGSEMVLEKLNLHRWQVPGDVRTVRWTFYADILNAGSTYVREGLQYVNPVNCLVYEVGAEDVGYEICLCDVPTHWSIATALPYSVVDGNYVLRARDMQHLMDGPWMAAPELWHA
jgi:predicted metalloprotease with PDZ domain